MRAVLIDSDVFVEVSRGRNDAILKRWDELSQGEAMTAYSPVTVAEIWHGALPHEFPILRALFAAMTCIPVDAEIGQRAGSYLQQFSRSHRTELGDALIAATASVHKLELWTRNRKHYPMKDVVFY